MGAGGALVAKGQEGVLMGVGVEQWVMTVAVVLS